MPPSSRPSSPNETGTGIYSITCKRRRRNSSRSWKSTPPLVRKIEQLIKDRPIAAAIVERLVDRLLASARRGHTGLTLAVLTGLF